MIISPIRGNQVGRHQSAKQHDQFKQQRNNPGQFVNPCKIGKFEAQQGQKDGQETKKETEECHQQNPLSIFQVSGYWNKNRLIKGKVLIPFARPTQTLLPGSNNGSRECKQGHLVSRIDEPQFEAFTLVQIVYGGRRGHK